MERLSFRGSVFWTLGLRGLGVPVQIAFFVVAARALGVSQFGLFAISNALWQFVKVCGPLGFDQAILRFVPAALVVGEERDALGVETWTRHRVTSWMVMIGGGLTAIGGLWSASRGGQAVSSVMATAVALPGFALLGLQTAQLRARGRVVWAQLPDSLGVYIVATALIAVAWRPIGPQLATFLWAQAIAAYSMVIVQRLLLPASRSARASWSNEPLRSQMSQAARGAWLAQLATTASGRLPTLIAGAVVGSGGAGLLEAASRVGQASSIVTWAAGVSVSPLFAEAHAKNEKFRMATLLAVATLTAAIPAGLVVLAVVLFGAPILEIFGPDFAIARPALIIVAMASAINAIGGLSSNLLYMTGHERSVATCSVVSLIVLLIVGVVGGRYFGVVGVSVGMLVATAVRDGSCSFILERRVGLPPPLLSGAGLAALLRDLRSRLSP